MRVSQKAKTLLLIAILVSFTGTAFAFQNMTFSGGFEEWLAWWDINSKPAKEFGGRLKYTTDVGFITGFSTSASYSFTPSFTTGLGLEYLSSFIQDAVSKDPKLSKVSNALSAFKGQWVNQVSGILSIAAVFNYGKLSGIMTAKPDKDVAVRPSDFEYEWQKTHNEVWKTFSTEWIKGDLLFGPDHALYSSKGVPPLTPIGGFRYVYYKVPLPWGYLVEGPDVGTQIPPKILDIQTSTVNAFYLMIGTVDPVLLLIPPNEKSYLYFDWILLLGKGSLIGDESNTISSFSWSNDLNAGVRIPYIGDKVRLVFRFGFHWIYTSYIKSETKILDSSQSNDQYKVQYVAPFLEDNLYGVNMDLKVFF